jgi:predicted dehydrogenase
MHAQAVAAVAGANLYACADIDQERRVAFEKEYSPKKSYGKYDDLLHDQDVDVVILSAQLSTLSRFACGAGVGQACLV